MVDYIILGQGICGSWMGYNLLKEGKTIMVIDNEAPFTASRIASGVINPVTGRRVVKTWMIDEIMNYAADAYKAFEEAHNTKIISETNILSFHATQQMKDAHDTRLPNQLDYLHIPENESQWEAYFNYRFGITEVSPSWLVDMPSFVLHARETFIKNNSYLKDDFKWEDCIVTNEYVVYKGIKASTIICCDGAAGAEDNPYFTLLPYAKNKGEVLILSIPDLPRNHIYKQNITITPWKDDFFWVGSSYEWNFSDDKPSATFRIKTELQLQQWLKLRYSVREHISALRPANLERRPFAGIHPHHPRVAILNGMGTKGCSLSPFFANQLTQHLVHGTPITPEADVNRFTKVLARG